MGVEGQEREGSREEGSAAITTVDRRTFLQMGLAIVGVFAGGRLVAAVSTMKFGIPAGQETLANYPYKPHYSMVIRQGLCIDCEICIEACNKANNVPSYGYRTRILSRREPNAVGRKLEFIPTLCNHCNTAPCTRGCPTLATFKDPRHGIVMMEDEKCIGCKACVLACPYEARYFNHEKGAIDKCNFCWDTRLSKGKKTAACVDVCPSGARIFGDLSDPNEMVFSLVHQLEEMVWVLRPESGAKPNVFYMKGTTTKFGIPAIPQLEVR